MSTVTPNFGYTKPDGATDLALVDVLNTDWDLIDEDLVTAAVEREASMWKMISSGGHNFVPSNNTYFLVSYTSVDSDSDVGNFLVNPGLDTVTIQDAGIYWVQGVARWNKDDLTPSVPRRDIVIQRNSADLAQDMFWSSSASNITQGQTVEWLGFLSGGDTIRMRARCVANNLPLCCDTMDINLSGPQECASLTIVQVY